MPLKSKTLTKAQQDLFNFMSSNYPGIDLFDLAKSIPSDDVYPPELIAVSIHNVSDPNSPQMSFVVDDVIDAMKHHNTNVIDLADSLSDNNAIMITHANDYLQGNYGNYGVSMLYHHLMIYEYQGKLKSKVEKIRWI